MWKTVTLPGFERTLINLRELLSSDGANTWPGRQIRIDAALSLDKAVKIILDGANDINVVIGPLCWLTGNFWYFVIATSAVERGFRADQAVLDGPNDDDDLRANLRANLIAAMTRWRQPRLVIHAREDELDMARLCASLWPCERIIGICKEIEEERAGLDTTARASKLPARANTGRPQEQPQGLKFGGNVERAMNDAAGGHEHSARA